MKSFTIPNECFVDGKNEEKFKIFVGMSAHELLKTTDGMYLSVRDGDWAFKGPNDNEMKDGIYHLSKYWCQDIRSNPSVNKFAGTPCFCITIKNQAVTEITKHLPGKSTTHKSSLITE